MLAFNRLHFSAGLLGTWIVGMGRYWDDTRAELLQYLGLGSVIYIFVLSAFIWILLWPFRIAKWNYFTVLTFISLTSFPAIFYAIPVEQYYSHQVASQINVWFLAIVALWRLALLFFFLKRFCRLSSWTVIVVTLLPICLIITSLWALNLHKVVFMVMGGFREPNSYDASYMILSVLTLVSAVLTLPLLISYFTAIFFNRRKSISSSE
ncbi:hypothetical protein N8482_00760 [Chitinophagales bacterium]|nr:hypothetical protein [Chitinophagales bacterium]